LNQFLRAAGLPALAFAVLLAYSSMALAQRFDVAVGGGSMFAPKASQADSSHSPVSLSGGAYFSASGDVLLHNQFGVEAEVAWKGSRGIYYPGGFNQHYRPTFADVNAIWTGKRSKRLVPELMAGAGVENIRFYAGTGCTFTTCTHFVTSNHFMVHVGGGLRCQVFHGLFIRPEGHLYLVHNNVEFSSDHAVRYGASLGYTF